MAMTKRKPPDLWHNYRDERHRIVFIEYQDGHPFSVVTEEHWDHSRKPWFVPGRDEPTGTCANDWDFEWCKRDRTCYFHQSGTGGGDPLQCEVHRFTHPDPPPGAIWCASDVVLTRWISAEKTDVQIRSDVTLLKMGYVRLARPLLLRGNGKRSRNPFLTSDEVDTHILWCERCKDHIPGDAECEHIEWCDRCSWWIYGDTHVRLDSHDDKPTVHDGEDDDA
jgi:hypothetical protein